MLVTSELLDELLKDYKSLNDVSGDDGLLRRLTKDVAERAPQGETTHHLGYERHDPAARNSGNFRNCKSSKTLRGKRRSQQRVRAGRAPARCGHACRSFTASKCRPISVRLSRAAPISASHSPVESRFCSDAIDETVDITRQSSAS